MAGTPNTRYSIGTQHNFPYILKVKLHKKIVRRVDSSFDRTVTNLRIQILRCDFKNV